MGADAFAWPASGVGEHTGRVLLQTTHAPVLRAIIQSSSGRAVHVTPGARLPAGQRARSPSGRSFSPVWPWPVLSQLVLLTHTPICGDAALKCSTVATWWRWPMRWPTRRCPSPAPAGAAAAPSSTTTAARPALSDCSWVIGPHSRSSPPGGAILRESTSSAAVEEVGSKRPHWPGPVN